MEKNQEKSEEKNPWKFGGKSEENLEKIEYFDDFRAASKKKKKETEHQSGDEADAEDVEGAEGEPSEAAPAPKAAPKVKSAATPKKPKPNKYVPKKFVKFQKHHILTKKKNREFLLTFFAIFHFFAKIIRETLFWFFNHFYFAKFFSRKNSWNFVYIFKSL